MPPRRFTRQSDGYLVPARIRMGNPMGCYVVRHVRYLYVPE